MMKTLKLVLTSVTMFAVLIGGDESRIGTSGGNQVLVPVGARGIALAGSERVYSSGLESVYWNPAGLARSQSPTVLASSMDLFNDMGDIPVTTVEDMDGLGGGTFKPTLTTMGVTYANSFSDRSFFGVTGKIVYESIPRATASALALDIGVQYTGLAGVDGLGLALVLNNIGTDMHYEGSGLTGQGTTEDGISDFLNREASYDKLPSTYNMSLSYSVAGAILGMTYTSHNFSYDELNLGGEYTLNDMFHLRAGLTSPMLEEDSMNDGETLYSMNFGAGLKYSLYGVNLVVDYTMRNQSDTFNTSNVFSVGLVF